MREHQIDAQGESGKAKGREARRLKGKGRRWSGFSFPSSIYVCGISLCGTHKQKGKGDKERDAINRSSPVIPAQPQSHLSSLLSPHPYHMLFVIIGSSVPNGPTHSSPSISRTNKQIKIPPPDRQPTDRLYFLLSRNCSFVENEYKWKECLCVDVFCLLCG